MRGYNEEGTTPFDTTVLNGLDRFYLVQSVFDCLPVTQAGAALKQAMERKLADHNAYIRIHGQDMPEIRNWKWASIEPGKVYTP